MAAFKAASSASSWSPSPLASSYEPPQSDWRDNDFEFHHLTFLRDANSPPPYPLFSYVMGERKSREKADIYIYIYGEIFIY